MEPKATSAVADKRSRAETYDKILKFNCDECKEPLENYESAVNHFQRQHQIIGYAFCCDKQFEFGPKLDTHIKNHYTDDGQLNISNECGHCQRQFKTAKALTLHIRAKHKAGNSVSCPDCPMKFHNASGLKMHARQVHVNPKKGTKCRACDIM